jgi:hypothetical protein
MTMGERMRNGMLKFPLQAGGRKRPITGNQEAPITGGVPGYAENSGEPVLTCGSHRENDMRHILDVRVSRAKAPNPFGSRHGGGPTVIKSHHINRDSKIALHTERTRLQDYGQRAKKP